MNTLQKFSLTSVGAAFITLGTAGASPAVTCPALSLCSNVQALGNGDMLSYAKTDSSEVGLKFTKNALLGLPQPGVDATPANAEKDDHTGYSTYAYNPLVLPTDPVSGNPFTVFNHVGLGWQPDGHPPRDPATFPGNIYGYPHFDVHFFLLTPAEREQITVAYDDPNPNVNAPPSPYVSPTSDFLALGYGNTGHYGENEGSHWSDVAAAPELCPFRGECAPQGTVDNPLFTSTMIEGYGYNGSLNFIEPMITKAFFEQTETTGIPFVGEVKLPASVADAGLYPTQYSISYDSNAQEFTVAMNQLEFRSATAVPVPFEPSSTLGLLALGAWGAFNRFKQQKFQ